MYVIVSEWKIRPWKIVTPENDKSWPDRLWAQRIVLERIDSYPNLKFQEILPSATNGQSWYFQRMVRRWELSMRLYVSLVNCTTIDMSFGNNQCCEINSTNYENKYLTTLFEVRHIDCFALCTFTFYVPKHSQHNQLIFVHPNIPFNNVAVASVKLQMTVYGHRDW